MKLTKLLLLVPAFMMIACKSATTSESQSQPKGPETKVSAEVFNDQVNGCGFLKPGYNKKVTTRMVYDGESRKFDIEQDGQKYAGTYGLEEYYFSIDPQTLNPRDDKYDIVGYFYEEGKWESGIEKLTLSVFAEMLLNYCPFEVSFEDFTYDEQKKAYTAEDLLVEAHEQGDPDSGAYPIEILSAEYKFEDEQLLSINIVMPGEDGDAMFSLETSMVGKVSITLPVVE